MNNHHLSRGGDGKPSAKEHEFNIRRKIDSHINRRHFLRECIEEKVLPKSTPVQLSDNHTPFSDSAKKYLEESCEKLTNAIYELKGKSNKVHLPHHMITSLKTINNKQKEKLKQKLDILYEKSNWKDMGRQDLITNLSKKTLTNTEREVLSLGLKFDTGNDQDSYAELVSRNYKWNDTDVDKGFKQGILLCCKAFSDNKTSQIPRRYKKALQDLKNDQEIIITQADKGGGIMIMDRTDYINKMNTLLEDTTIYEKKHIGYAQQSADTFNKKARKILKKNERGKKLLHLVEEAPRPPQIRGIPKVHKPGIPLRPITSGIGSAPHRIAKQLAKPLSQMLGKISGTHLKNSGHTNNRLKDIQLKDKKLYSLI
ncbi:uncharacterized protein LOC143034752 [Oratosquilla oratoria]|uniref:uncharacterized protein LOC143034752 n=1 Tax=Oratosquilla oratoria TaxID=337810 RepID=UPI003F765127